MYGWRARIGLIIPSSASTIEPEFYKMVPEGVSVHTSRILLTEMTPENILGMSKHATRAAKELKTAGADILIFGCTAGTFLKGLQYDSKIISNLEKETSIPTITTSTAALEALRICQIKNVTVATPYVDKINATLKTFLEESGFRVIKIQGLGLGERKKVFPLSELEISNIGIQEPYLSYKLVRRIFTNDADGFFISCTNLRTVEIIKMLEDDLGRPVISSNQASLAIALKRLGIKSEVKGFGTLFERCFSM